MPFCAQSHNRGRRTPFSRGITQGKGWLIEQKKALGIAERNDCPQGWYSGLLPSFERRLTD
jgi:hypothetical protein